MLRNVEVLSRTGIKRHVRKDDGLAWALREKRLMTNAVKGTRDEKRREKKTHYSSS